MFMYKKEYKEGNKGNTAKAYSIVVFYLNVILVKSWFTLYHELCTVYVTVCLKI